MGVDEEAAVPVAALDEAEQVGPSGGGDGLEVAVLTCRPQSEVGEGFHQISPGEAATVAARGPSLAGGRGQELDVVP